MFVKLQKVKLLVGGEGPDTFSDIWIRGESILKMYKADKYTFLSTTDKDAFLVKESPEEIVDLVDPPITEADRQLLANFGLEVA